MNITKKLKDNASKENEKPAEVQKTSAAPSNPPIDPDDENKNKDKGPEKDPKSENLSKKEAVGTYRELKKAAQRGDNLDIHHMPNDKYMASKGVSKKDGISINVEKQRHIEIHKELRSIDPKTSERDALAKSVLRAKKVYEKEGAYSPKTRDSFQEVIKQNKEKFPHLFEKK
jgi:hypothetical protein